MSRYDSDGLFWREFDYKTTKAHDFLEEQEWVQVAPGFWAEQSRLDAGEDISRIALLESYAYKIARANKTGEKRTPPEPVWLAADYLPGLEEAREFNIPIMPDQHLIELSYEFYLTGKKHKLIFDIECYGNFFLIAFYSMELGSVFYLELSDDAELDCRKLQWVFDKFCVVGFNSRNYDMIIAALAVHGWGTGQMKAATSMIIEEGQRGWQVLRQFKTKSLQEADHIDLIEVAPLFASLKIYGGRMHTARMQDLPFPPDSILSEPQRAIVRWYCVNDLRVTAELYKKLEKDIDLRVTMGRVHGEDLRSKSDAQIAETVLGNQIAALNHSKPHAPYIEPGTVYHYRRPDYLTFQTPGMQSVLNRVLESPFIVSEYGNIGLPTELKELDILIGNTIYSMGIGGLHSMERKASHIARSNMILKDMDMTSYYPYIILNQELYPHHLGPNFLNAFRAQVEDRVAAKRDGRDTVAASLKILINGTFGKLGNQFSAFYAPDLLIQVTITGQLTLLMLIELLELAGIPVVSANTDGIVIFCDKEKEPLLKQVVSDWEKVAGFNVESTEYCALFSRDINNYIAVKDPKTWSDKDELDDRVKTKGIFASPGLSKNPQNEICILAIKEYLITGRPIESTIRECRDIRKFLNVRTVKGGAVKLYSEGQPGLYLGKAIRWYYAKNIPGEIVYARSGNKVPKSEGAQPLMTLPNDLPLDIDYEWYEKETRKILKAIDCV